MPRRAHPLLGLGSAMAMAALAGCGPTVPDIPQAARSQTPRAAPRAPWFAQGRLELVLPGKRISCTALVRGLGDGRARLALMDDVSGLQLVDLTSTADGYEVTQAMDELKKALPELGRLLRHAWGLPADLPGDLRWRDDALAARTGDVTRWYGGDPVLLRAVEGDGLDIAVEDYRPLGDELIAHEARAKGPLGITIRLHLDDDKAWLRPVPAPTVPPAQATAPENLGPGKRPVPAPAGEPAVPAIDSATPQR